MVISMSILHEKRPAEKFVDYMHNNHTTLNVFVKLLCMWTQLSTDERQEVYDICELNHPQLYHGIFPEESDSDEDSWES